MSVPPCGNPECPAQWCDLPCTCPKEPAADLATVLWGTADLVDVRAPELSPELLQKLTTPAPESWFCGVHGIEKTGPADVCSCELTVEQSLLVALTELLTEAQHPVGVCYITPDETECHCLIGRVKAVLPRCQERRTAYGHNTTGVQRLGEPAEPYWRCVLIEHPDNPDGHQFEDV